MTDRAADDARWMHAAIALSERGRALSDPNPNVACLIVQSGRVVGRGWTQPGGRPHAEAMAVEAAAEAARGATAYVTLEPCIHQSARGPACANLLQAAGVSRVVAALTDPDSRMSGRGFAQLRQQNIDVLEIPQSIAARRAMAGFLFRTLFGRPVVTLKLALSLDGAVATGDGRSQWITGNEARAHGHLERARHRFILVGRGTVEADTPRLDVRLAGLEQRSPRRVMLGSGKPPDGWQVIGNPEEIATLAGNSVLVEGGAMTAASFLKADLVDRLLIYRAPILIGGGRTLPDIGLGDLAAAHGRWNLVDSRPLGSDRLEVYERNRSLRAN